MSGWLIQSFLSLAIAIPAWLILGFFDRNLGISSNVFAIWYFLGMSISAGLVVATGSKPLVPSWPMVLVIVVIGIFIGGGANLLLFKAVTTAQNPGIPIAISNTTSIGVILITMLLYQWLPQYFQQVKFDFRDFIGVVLTIVGLTIIVIKK